MLLEIALADKNYILPIVLYTLFAQYIYDLGTTRDKKYCNTRIYFYNVVATYLNHV